MKRKVIAFGSFDPLHKGHISFLRQAKACGDELLVVVARDSTIRAEKDREPYLLEEGRLSAVRDVPYVSTVMLGNEYPHHFDLLSELQFDVIALGYDQNPSDEVVQQELVKRGKGNVDVVRLRPYKPHIYKSTLIRKKL